MTDVQTRPETDIAGAAGTDDKGSRSTTATRRIVLTGAGALGAGCFLAACGTDTSGTATGSNGGDFSDNPAPAGSATAPAGGSDSASGTVLVAAADVPEGGGVIEGDYVITQPEAGTYKAFSKICTHQGCPVNEVKDGQIICPCHASYFDVKDGSVISGPAKSPLPETEVKLDGDNIVTA